MASVDFEDVITFTRESAGGRFNSAGVYEWVGNNVPRLDYDPITLQPRGLLVEEQRTNLLTYSEQFDNADWAKVGSTISPNVVASPDGTISADKLVESAANSAHSVQPTLAVVSGTTYTYSCFIKKAERTFARVSTFNGLATHGVAINLDTGQTAVTNGSPVAFGSVYVGAGWWRVWIASVATSSTPTALGSIGASTGFTLASATYAGDGTSGIYIWGADLQAGAFPTSHIPTEASQVTRAADVASVNTLSPWYNASEGTLFVEASAIGVPPGAGTSASFTDGTANNRIIVGQFFTTTRIGSVGVSNVDQAVFSVAAVSLNQPHKFAMAWAVNNFAASLDGLTPLTDTSGSIPTVTTLNIGALNTVQRFCGHIRSLRYWPRRLTNAELQQVTA